MFMHIGSPGRMERPVVWPWVRDFLVLCSRAHLQSIYLKKRKILVLMLVLQMPVGVPPTGWRCPRQVLWRWVRGERPQASGHMHCTEHYQALLHTKDM